MGGSLFLLAQQFQFVLGHTSLETGLRIVPFAVALLVGSGADGAPLGKRIGPARNVALSVVTAALGLYVVASDSGYGWILPGLIVVGFAMGTAAPAALVARFGAGLPSGMPDGAGESLPTALAAVDGRAAEVRGAFVFALETSQFLDALAMAVGAVVSGGPADPDRHSSV